MIPDQFGALGLLKAMQKNSIKFMPIIGWNFWFTENIFLQRKAATDIKKIENGIDELVSSKTPFWMTLYGTIILMPYKCISSHFGFKNVYMNLKKAEGSRFTKEKHLASEEIAREKNFKSLEHHLQPRPTGFMTIIKKLRKNRVHYYRPYFQ